MKQVYFIRFFLILCLTVLGSPSWSQYQMENLDRGVVATSMGGTKVFISWRWLGTEPDNITFNLYRGTTKLNSTPLTVSNYTDNSGSTSASYTVRAVLNGVEQAASDPVMPWAQQFLKVPVQTPAGGTTPDGVAYTYNANDASVADLDGDGKYEIILKWDPSNSKDNSQSGYTGNTYVDAYKLDGTRLWRIDFGINIRSGAHYMDFMVYDFDGDGKAEMMCRTADGTKDAVGTIIGTANADYRNSSGYVLSGPEYISVFNGFTGAVMATSNYIPARGTVSSWGDSYGNRVDRFRAGVAYVDGQHPTGVFCRGYYTRAVVAAWDWRGGKLTNRWTFDSNNSGNSSYAGQGDHSLSIADVDNDGKQEVIVGSAIIDDNGSGYYNTTFGHGDALHVSDLDPDLPGLEVFNIQERLDVEGAYMYSATNKQVLWTKPTLLDGSQTEGPGRGVCGDITSAYRGAESWVAGGGISGTWDCKGNQFSTSVPASCNFLIWWDGDLLRELLNNTMIDKYGTGRILTAYNIAPIASNNGTKSTPCLSGDIIGDWREEVIWRGSANDALYIFTTNTPSTYKFRTFMHEPQYRVAIAWQNTGYNQPPHVGFYLGDGMTTPPTPNIVIVGQNITNTPPSVDLTAPANNASYCSGTAITLTANATDANGTISKVEFYDGTTLLGTINSSPYTYNWANTGTGTHVLTAKATDNDNAITTSSAVNITVNAIPSVPVVTTPVTYCQNAVASALTATGTGLKWYAVASGGTASATAPTPVTTSTGTTNYYVSQTTNNCESARALIAVTVNAIPSVPVVTTPVTYCQNAVASALTATGTGLKWYAVASGGTASTTAPTPVTTSTGITNYYVSQTMNNCESARALIAVTVNSLPTAPIMTTPVTYCQNAVASALTANGSGLIWYTVASSGIGSSTAPIPATSLVGTTNYYVSQTTNNCESPRVMISVTVNALPSAPGVTTPVTYCQNAIASALTANGTGLKWYTVASGGIGSATAPTPVTSVIGTTNYYVSQTPNNCESARAMISVSVNAPTVIVPYVQINGTWQQQNFGQICEGNSIVLGPQPTTPTGWSWTGPNNFIATTREISFNNINSSQGGTYIATFLDGNGCLSTSNINIFVSPLPSSPTVNSQISYCQNATATPLTAGGTSLKWYTVPVGGTGTITAPIPVTGAIGTTNYYVSQTTNNCESSRAMIAVTTNSLPSAVISPSGPITFAQGGSVSLTSSIGSSYIWFNGTTPVGTDMSYTATSSGNYSVEVTNASGCKNTSDQVIVTVNPNISPVVSITVPVNNAVFTAPANITLTAVATDTDGTISKVDFYNGTVLIGTDPTSSYNFALNNLPAGTYSVTAVATDNLGLSTTSSSVIFTVNSPPNQLPQVNITSPLNGSTYVENASVVIEATASDVDGNITQVEFFNGNSLLGTDNSVSYSFTWSPVLAGSYNITARATDNNGGVSTSSVVSITVNGNQPSIISITSPVDNSNITSNSVTINVTATDPDGTITLVEFYDGTTLIGSTTNQPYIFTWENPTVGLHVITVKVTDSNGGITTSSPTSLTVSTQTAVLSGKSKDAYCKIFPNPTNNVIQIETGVNLKSATFVFLDPFGSEVNLPLTIYDHDAKLDVSIVPSGVYFLTITKDDFVVSKKIIVIH